MVDSVKYKVARTIDGVEIREYPKLLLATVSGKDDNAAFSILFQFISGSNSKREKLSMTAPVVSAEQRGSSEGGTMKVPMTAPVVSGTGFFTFVMPSGYTAKTLPEPLDERIKVHVQAPKTFAVLRFGGRAKPEAVEKRISELLKILSERRLKTRGYPFLMRYNSPFTPGFLRRNEVGIEIVRTAK